MYYANPPRVMVTGEWMEGAPPLRARLTATWNGWAVPAFARAEVDAVIRAQEALRADVSNPDDELDGYVRIEWRGDDVIATELAGSPDEYVQVIEPNNIDGEQVWEMGLGWTWETLPFDDPAVPSPPQKTRFEALRAGLADGESVYSADGTVEADGSHTFYVRRAAAEQPDPRYTRMETVRTVRIARDGSATEADEGPGSPCIEHRFVGGTALVDFEEFAVDVVQERGIARAVAETMLRTGLPYKWNEDCGDPEFYAEFEVTDADALREQLGELAKEER